MRASGKDGSAEPGGHRWWRAGVVVVLVVAAAVRVVTLPVGLPYSSYVDEGYVLDAAAHQLHEKTVDPDFYQYPSFVIDATAAAALAAAVVTGRTQELAEGVEREDRSPFYGQTEPLDLILAGRLLVLAASIGTVAVTMALGRRLGGRRLGLVAGLLIAVLPAVVSRSAIVVVDTPAAFFVMTTLLLGHGFGTARRPFWVAAAGGVTAGLAATSKYPSASVVLGLLTFVALASARPLRQRAAAGGVAVAAMVATVLVAMPALVLDPSAVRLDLYHLRGSYGSKGGPTYLAQLVRPEEVGWVLLVPAVAGLALLLVVRRTRGFALAWLAFAVPLSVAALAQPFQPMRNLVPLLPGLCLAAAATLVAAGDGVARLGGAGHRRAVGSVVAIGGAAAIGVVLFLGGVQPYLRDQLDAVNSRVEAVRWLEVNTGAGDRILVAAELRFLPTELAEVPGDVVVASAIDEGDDRPYRADDFDVVVAGPIDAPVHDWAAPAPPGTEAVSFGSGAVIPAKPGRFVPPSVPLWIRRT